MNFDLDADERALQEGIRELCRGRITLERLRAAGDHVEGTIVRELADAGVFALRLLTEEGGIGGGMTHAVVVNEELGRALVPGPLVATQLAAGRIPGAADGHQLVGSVERSRRPTVVGHLADLAVLVVVDDEGLWQTDPAMLAGVTPDRPLDPLTPVTHVADLPQGDRLGGADDAHRWRQEHRTLTAAFLLGIALATTDLAVAYATQREQFGRLIGSFQAVKHLCADMLTRAEVARAAVYAAAVLLDDPQAGGDEQDRAVHAAALLAADAAERNGKACVQVHGGMGFTWEVDAHLYLKRAMVLTADLGGTDRHAEAMAAGLTT